MSGNFDDATRADLTTKGPNPPTPAPTLPSTTHNPNPDCCDFYLLRKKRFCKIVKRVVEIERIADSKAQGILHRTRPAAVASSSVTVNPEATDSSTSSPQEFCAMHQQELAAGIAVGNGVARGTSQMALVSGMAKDARGLRVPCPLNPNHSVYEKDLRRHITVCPDRRFVAVEDAPHISKSLHAFVGCFSYSPIIASNTTNAHHQQQHHNLSSVVAIGRTPVVPITSQMKSDLELKAAAVTAAKEIKAGDSIQIHQDTKRRAAKMSADAAIERRHHSNNNTAENNASSITSEERKEDRTAIGAAEEPARVETDVEQHHDDVDGHDYHDDVGVGNSSSTSARITHRDLSHADLRALIDSIHAYYETYVKNHIELIQYKPTTTASTFGGRASASMLPDQKHDPQHDRLHTLITPMLIHHPRKGQQQQGANDQTKDEEEEDAQPITVVEMGAGKAGLGASLVEALLLVKQPPVPPPTTTAIIRPIRVLVADLGGFRRKADAGAQVLIARNHSKHNNGEDRKASAAAVLSYNRLRVNLKDLNLPEALLANCQGDGSEKDAVVLAAGEKRTRPEDEEEKNDVQKQQHPSLDFVSIGKHLCGACTDFAISCSVFGRQSDKISTLLVGGVGGVGNSEDTDTTTTTNSSTAWCKGLVVATCCHHRCEPQHLCHPHSISAPPPSTVTYDDGAFKGIPCFFPTYAELVMLPSSSSKPTSSASTSSSSSSASPTPSLNTINELHALISITSWAVSGAHAVPDPRNRLAGRYAKRIIDFHRAMFLQRILNMQHPITTSSNSNSSQYRVRLVEYIDADVTPENVALVVDILS